MRLHFLDHDPDHFLVSTCHESMVPVQANIPTLYALEEHVSEMELSMEGATLIVGKKNLLTPLGLECFKHYIYLNTVFHTYPKLSTKAPAPEGVPKPEDYEHHLNSLRNLPVFHEFNHVGFLDRIALESPALIIQPGPSLDPAFIHDLAGRCVTIAISRCLPLLLEHGIVPDLVYQQDTTQYSWDTSFSVLEGRRLDSALVANPVGYLHKYFKCFSHVYKSWNFFPFEVDRMDHVLHSIPPSTTSGAFSLARHLGCNPIILHGGDFGSLAPGETVHCRFWFSPQFCQDEKDVLIFRPLPELQHRLILPLSEGRTIATSVDYLSASQWLKREALRLAVDRPDLAIMDRSDTGMLCESSVIKPFTPDALQGRTRRLLLRHYTAPFRWDDFIREILRRYKAIRRILAKTGRTPDISLVNPYNSIYTGMPGFTTKPFPLTPEEVAIALARVDEVLAVLQDILAQA